MSEMSPEMPPDPFIGGDFTPMAKNTFDMMTAFLAAGFTRDDARFFVLEIIKTMIASTVVPPQKGK